ncbi:MAG: GIY-YIG nuclease family protein [Pseudomonadales bacterium]|nr:GIY-YIG nuclease family protein [Pseudomonadales bacterium]NRA17191.1 GIY-YIG nuclease family protein [Oceanospirillaceae bacterium]
MSSSTVSSPKKSSPADKPAAKAQSKSKPKSQWFVYLARCADSSLYAGVTTDCQRREREHNGQGKAGARYTKTRRPVQIVWSEPHPDRSSACKREAAIKKISRRDKLGLIRGSSEYRVASSELRDKVASNES